MVISDNGLVWFNWILFGLNWFSQFKRSSPSSKLVDTSSTHRNAPFFYASPLIVSGQVR